MSEYNPFDWRGPSESGLVKERSPEAIQKANAAAKLAAIRVNPESHIAFSNRESSDRTNAIRNSTP